MKRVKEESFYNLLESHKEKEGIVIMGCGGEIEDWPPQIVQWLNDDKVIDEKDGKVIQCVQRPEDDPDYIASFEDLFEDVFLMTTSEGRYDLFFVFSEDTKLNIGRLAIVRLMMQDMSWWSDYVVNYKNDHTKSVKPVQIKQDNDDNESEEEWEKPVVPLVGEDSNAGAIIGRVTKALRKAGAPKKVIDEYREKAMSGDYNNLLNVTMEYIELPDEEEEECW